MRIQDKTRQRKDTISAGLGSESAGAACKVGGLQAVGEVLMHLQAQHQIAWELHSTLAAVRVNHSRCTGSHWHWCRRSEEGLNEYPQRMTFCWPQ